MEKKVWIGIAVCALLAFFIVVITPKENLQCVTCEVVELRDGAWYDSDVLIVNCSGKILGLEVGNVLQYVVNQSLSFCEDGPRGNRIITTHELFEE